MNENIDTQGQEAVNKVVMSEVAAEMRWII
jgi:hypothetical protein